MKTLSRLLLRLSLIASLSIGAGCSLKTGSQAGQGLAVKLLPRESDLRDGALESLFNKDWMMLMSSPTQLSDLTCFGVNVRGGTTEATGTCNGKVMLGSTAGFQQGVSSPFTMSNVPLSDGLIFEAYGYQGSCGTLSPASGMPAGLAIYPLGSVTPSPGELAGTITIPVSFSSSKALDCTPSGAGGYALFQDLFQYGTNSGTLVGESNGVWFAPTTDMAYSTNGQVGFTVTANQADFISASVESFNDTGYVISSLMTLSLPPGGGSYQVAVGLADSQSNSANSVGCVVSYNATPPTVTIQAGAATNGLYNGGATTTVSFANGHQLSLTCSITRILGQVEIIATAFDTSAPVIAIAPAIPLPVAIPCIGGCTAPYMAQNQGGVAATGSINSYTLVGVP